MLDQDTNGTYNEISLCGWGAGMYGDHNYSIVNGVGGRQRSAIHHRND